MRLEVGDPEALVVVQQDDSRRDGIERRAADLKIRDLDTATIPRLVVPEQPGMHDLLAADCCTPAEVADRVAAMRPCLDRPERDRAIGRKRIRLRPVDLPGLLLRHQLTGDLSAAEQARLYFSGLTHLCAVAKDPGFLPRALALDGASHYVNSSVDQYTMFFFALLRFFRSSLATPEDRATIQRIWEAVLVRWERARVGSGRAITSVRAVARGDAITAHLSDGSLACTEEEVTSPGVFNPIDAGKPFG